MHKILSTVAMILGLIVVCSAFAAPQPQHKPMAKVPEVKKVVKTEAKKAPPPVVKKTAAKPQEEGSVSSLPVPRFVTLGANEVNLRTGPGFRYPIRLVIRKAGLPIEIIREFDVWRQIRDRDGDEGWVHQSMLSGRRAVIIKDGTQTLQSAPQEDARPVVRLEQGVIANLDTCKNHWCHLKIASYDGWLKRNTVWGIYPRETFQE